MHNLEQLGAGMLEDMKIKYWRQKKLGDNFLMEEERGSDEGLKNSKVVEESTT